MIDYQILQGRGNLKKVYKSCLEEHRVKIDKSDFYLIKTFYGTNTREDFLRTFPLFLDDNLLEKVEIIPNEISYNEYGILYDVQNLKVVAVFNMRFAHYDARKKKIIFKDPEDILLTYHKIAADSPKLSLEEQFRAKLKACQEKVNAKIVKTPKQEDIQDLKKKLKNEFKKIPINHVIMYAAVPPLKK